MGETCAMNAFSANLGGYNLKLFLWRFSPSHDDVPSGKLLSFSRLLPRKKWVLRLCDYVIKKCK